MEFHIFCNFLKFAHDFQKMFAFSNLFKFSKKFNIFNTLFGFLKKMFDFFVQVSNNIPFFSKNVQIFFVFQNVFGVSKFVRDFQKMFVFSNLFRFQKVLEFYICSHFSKLARDFQKVFVFSNLF